GPAFACGQVRDQAMVSYRCKKFFHAFIQQIPFHQYPGCYTSRLTDTKPRFPADFAILCLGIRSVHFSKWDATSNFSSGIDAVCNTLFAILIAPKTLFS